MDDIEGKARAVTSAIANLVDARAGERENPHSMGTYYEEVALTDAIVALINEVKAAWT